MDGRPDPDRLVNPDAYAAHAGVSRAQVYRWLNDGLPSLKLGKLRRIRVGEADAWLTEQAGGAA